MTAVEEGALGCGQALSHCRRTRVRESRAVEILVIIIKVRNGQ